MKKKEDNSSSSNSRKRPSKRNRPIPGTSPGAPNLVETVASSSHLTDSGGGNPLRSLGQVQHSKRQKCNSVTALGVSSEASSGHGLTYQRDLLGRIGHPLREPGVKIRKRRRNQKELTAPEWPPSTNRGRSRDKDAEPSKRSKRKRTTEAKHRRKVKFRKRRKTGKQKKQMLRQRQKLKQLKTYRVMKQQRLWRELEKKLN